MIEYSDVLEAYDRIKEVVNKTPVLTSSTLNRMSKSELFFKCESFQKVGAFKMRGAYNAISKLSQSQKEKGVIAHSSGNHAQAVALSAKLLGIKATIVMPNTSPQVKVNATRDTYGATVVFCENTSVARQKATDELISQYGYTFIHPYDNYDIIAGAGTATYEFLNQVNNLDMIFCPIGGGGLISGTLIAANGFNSNIEIYGAEPQLVDDAFRSLNSGRIEHNKTRNSIADGLLTDLSEKTFGIIRKYINDIINVSEFEILEAMRLLWERMKIVVEPSGACSLAAALTKRISIQNKRVGILLSGGNLDLDPIFQSLKARIEKN
ncbi:MAG: pyridoxal-phosphate dependent enzyme [Candidatus Lokiarchaeota archaeon]|nr:pyridoxal-phosphate dependent enzyme [Candidatus Lokiarchaeota archaeon]MBD3201213.1 pyridoxal-phosphate dependent enzyme [Candidatus Lokiarchaeota archaeon]